MMGGIYAGKASIKRLKMLIMTSFSFCDSKVRTATNVKRDESR
jgi:hypothetical protein